MFHSRLFAVVAAAVLPFLLTACGEFFVAGPSTAMVTAEPTVVVPASPAESSSPADSHSAGPVVSEHLPWLLADAEVTSEPTAFVAYGDLQVDGGVPVAGALAPAEYQLAGPAPGLGDVAYTVGLVPLDSLGAAAARTALPSVSDSVPGGAPPAVSSSAAAQLPLCAPVPVAYAGAVPSDRELVSFRPPRGHTWSHIRAATGASYAALAAMNDLSSLQVRRGRGLYAGAPVWVPGSPCRRS